MLPSKMVPLYNPVLSSKSQGKNNMDYDEAYDRIELAERFYDEAYDRIELAERLKE